MADQPYAYDTTRPHLMRLFKLDLNGADEPLSGKLLSITNIDFGYANIYATPLGDPREPRPLYVSSISNKKSSDGRAVTNYEPHRDGMLLIQKNLHAFLQAAAPSGCLEDKDNQITLMRYVYEAAELVYVWLGEAAAAEESTVLAMPTLNSDLRALPEGHKLDPTNPDSFEVIGIPAPSQEVWRPLSTIIARPWWSRLWTLQEVVVAPNEPSFDKKVDHKPPNATIICGESQAQWNTFEDLISVIQANGLEEWLLAMNGPPSDDGVDHRHAFASLEEIRTCRRGNAGWAISLSALLLATRRRRATLPADMSAQPARDGFVRYGKHYIRQEPRECLLNHARAAEMMPGLPGWCPNFASRPETAPLASRRLLPVSVYDDDRPAGDTAQQALPRQALRHHPAGPRLGAQPVQHGRPAADPPRRVDGRDPARRAGGGRGGRGGRRRQQQPAASRPSRGTSGASPWRAGPSPGGADGFDALARTLIADDRDPADPQLCAAPHLRLRQHMQAVEAAGTAFPGVLDPDVQRYAEALRRVTRRRRFFATKGGRIGLGPAHTKAGDTLAVAFYCPTPYVLRRRAGEGEGRWGLVGEAYVHGVMYGEALRLFSEGRVEETSWVVE
ncbi:hypothetical protein INS49_010508 [Diaporthe citri]|uniref:uncharacterized protein n=1 Tax=Diaporthe citri TaxID=83186 RepID=UPI001C81B7A6|nr:uncharacterized protein INS49_010508 [Diaporthe citri]KAG6362278.1 hypothetical protein INS49_010508 [Diaporthe citri]